MSKSDKMAPAVAPEILQDLLDHFETKREAILRRDLDVLKTHYARPLAVYFDEIILLIESDRQMIEYFNVIFERCIREYDQDLAFEILQVHARGKDRFTVDAKWIFKGESPADILEQKARYMIRHTPDTGQFRTELIEGVEIEGSGLPEALQQLDSISS